MSANIDVEVFIRDIFIRRPIWDGSMGNRDLLWREISANHNFLPVDTLKVKWENLRRAFRRQLKKIPRNINNMYLIDPHNIASEWPYYRSMLFLVGQVRLGNQTQQFPPIIETKNESIPQYVDQNIPYNNANAFEFDQPIEKQNENALTSNAMSTGIDAYETQCAGNCIDIEERPIETPPPNVNRKRPSPDSYEEAVQPYKKKCTADPSNIERTSSSVTLDYIADSNTIEIASDCTLNWNDKNDSHLIEDSDRYYLKSLLPYFEKLDAVQKLAVRTKIDRILLAEIYVVNQNNVEA